MTHIICVTGIRLSGKTTVAEIIEDEGYAMLEGREILEEEKEKRDFQSMGEFVMTFREENGNTAIAELIVPYLEDTLETRERVVLSGLRNWEQKEHLESEAGEDITVIAVWASEETRMDRKIEGDHAEELDEEEFRRRDAEEIGYGVAEATVRSDYLIVNEGLSRDELRAETQAIVESIED